MEKTNKRRKKKKRKKERKRERKKENAEKIQEKMNPNQTLKFRIQSKYLEKKNIKVKMNE